MLTSDGTKHRGRQNPVCLIGEEFGFSRDESNRQARCGCGDTIHNISRLKLYLAALLAAIVSDRCPLLPSSCYRLSFRFAQNVPA